MKAEGTLLPDPKRVPSVDVDHTRESSTEVVFTRDHDIIRRWAAKRQAEPATGEATTTGPATVNVNDGGAGIRFNFPASGHFRPISWDEWFDNFDRHECAFVFDNDSSAPPSGRYRIVKAEDWKGVLE